MVLVKIKGTVIHVGIDPHVLIRWDICCFGPCVNALCLVVCCLCTLACIVVVFCLVLCVAPPSCAVPYDVAATHLSPSCLSPFLCFFAYLWLFAKAIKKKAVEWRPSWYGVIHRKIFSIVFRSCSFGFIY